MSFRRKLADSGVQYQYGSDEVLPAVAQKSRQPTASCCQKPATLASTYFVPFGKENDILPFQLEHT